ncbi:unnamed protein product [Meloidogyne enterolobii]|uniref:Uncharacterized protein n=1 Tax=Meloidogyne enterolobii TaxID=390850 RepID=A0ACB1AWI0_MELEN
MRKLIFLSAVFPFIFLHSFFSCFPILTIFFENGRTSLQWKSGISRLMERL